jgi:hypothetical protein
MLAAAMPDPVDDTQAYALLHDALMALGRASGRTVRGDTALKTARRALTLLQIALVAAGEAKDRERTSSPP